MSEPKSQKPTPSNSPNWSYWGNLATVNLREALQLSLGLDPHSHVPASEPDLSLRKCYWNRLSIAKDHAPGADWVFGRVVREDGDIHPEFTEVYVKKFATWVINGTTLRPLPDEFISLSEKQTQVVRDTLTDEPQSSSAVTASTDPSSLPDSPTLAVPLEVGSSSKRPRRDKIAPVIESAQRAVTDPNDVASVWNEMSAHAKEKNYPFLGIAPEGLIHEDQDGTTKIFDKNALRKRLRRAAKKAANGR
jgi:hypothetical protein